MNRQGLAVTIFLALFGAALAWSAYDDYQDTLAQEYRTLEGQARLGDVQIAGALRSMDLILQSVIDDVQATPRLPAQVIEQRQFGLLRQFPEIHYLIAVDIHGQVTTARSLDDPGGLATVQAFSAAQRDYFTIHRDAKPEDYYRRHISRPFKTITNRFTIVISRAIRGKNGQFQGVALISLSPTYFHSVLQQLLSNDALDAAAVHNRFGDIIYRLPNPEKYIGKNIAGGEAFQLYLNSGQHLTRFMGVTVTDNVNRVLVFSKVGDTDLDIAVATQFDVIMAKWRSDVWMKMLIFAIVAILSLTLSWEFQRRLRERRQGELALLESKKRFERAAETVPIVLYDFVVNPDGTTAFSYISQRSKEILGLDAETIMKDAGALWGLIDSDDLRRVQEEDRMARQLGRDFCAEFGITTPSGERKWLRAEAKPCLDQWGELLPTWSGFIEDITERTQQEQLRIEKEIAHRTALVREVHHRIKNNLQSVAGLLHRELGKFLALDPRLETAISQIDVVAAVHGLQASNPDEEIVLTHVLRNICKSISDLLQRPVLLELGDSPGKLESLVIDKDEAVPIALILNELILNAVKHSPQGSAAPSVSLTQLGETAQIVIRNAPAGMPDFDIANGKGIGTGLSLVRSLLPYEGAHLSYEQDAAGFMLAVMQLTCPIILAPPPPASQ